MSASSFTKRSAPDPLLRDALEAWRSQGDPGDDALIARVRNRVLAAIAPDPRVPFSTVPASDEGWTEIGPGVSRKVLWTTPSAQSCLVRLAPGAAVPGHAHPIDEECVVLQGCLRIGADVVLHPGDFHVARAGTRHELASSEAGALVYLRGAPDHHAPA
jgi:quercetin dioxygenase-like cupin family protein